MAARCAIWACETFAKQLASTETKPTHNRILLCLHMILPFWRRSCSRCSPPVDRTTTRRCIASNTRDLISSATMASILIPGLAQSHRKGAWSIGKTNSIILEGRDAFAGDLRDVDLQSVFLLIDYFDQAFSAGSQGWPAPVYFYLRGRQVRIGKRRRHARQRG